MIKYLFLLCMVCATARADVLKEFGIDYNRFHKGGRSIEIPGYEPKESISVHFNINLLGPIFWQNRVRALTEDGQYRYVAWNFVLGIQVTRGLQVGYEHLSQHLLDTTDIVYPGGKFPVNDSVTARWEIVLPHSVDPLLGPH